IILFLDELHTVVGAGAAQGAVDAANLLKPMLARGELRCVGATTLDEYRQHIEKDAALERRFQPVLVGEPSVEDTIAILRGLKERSAEMIAQWEAEKEAIQGISETKKRLEDARIEFERAEREANLQRAAELRYGEIPELERKVAELEAEEHERADGSGPVFLKDEV